MWCMSDPDPIVVVLHAARERTAERVHELALALDSIVEASKAANLDDEHDPEGSTVGFERAQTAALLEAARTQLTEIDAALDRTHRGAYGICERCGDPIPKARLEAKPATRVCVACAGDRDATRPSR
jgi:DnaK suppressor protein